MQTLGLYLGILTALIVTPAHAYIGPGVGAGTIAVVFGVIASILLAFVAIVWYPIKRLFAGLRVAPKKSEKTNQTFDELDIDNGSLHHSDRDAGSHSTRRGHRGD